MWTQELALQSACPASARPWVLSWGRGAVCYYLNEFNVGVMPYTTQEFNA